LTNGEQSGNVPFGTLTAIAESPMQFGLLVVGSDDGRVHVSPDNGYTWNDVSAGLPHGLWVSRIVMSAHQRNRMYVTLNGYRNDHFAPYVFVSDNLGKTWRSIANNLPLECVNVLREDSKHDQLLYAGTDHGLYVTTNAGAVWFAVCNDLPSVAIHDLVMQEREQDLVIGTHGRSIWIMDVEPLREFMQQKQEKVIVFNMPTIPWRSDWGGNWSKWLEPSIPTHDIAIFSDAIMKVHVDIQGPESMMLATLGDAELHAGFNRIPFDLSFDETQVKPLQDTLNKDKKVGEEVTIRKADNGKYSLPKGEYVVMLTGDFGSKSKAFSIE
jgi:hypothetical protein